jgi:hypothetical protein
VKQSNPISDIPLSAIENVEFYSIAQKSCRIWIRRFWAGSESQSKASKIDTILTFFLLELHQIFYPELKPNKMLLFHKTGVSVARKVRKVYYIMLYNL